MNDTRILGALSDHDKAELRKFETYLNRRHDKPEEPQFVTYGDVYGEVVFEDTPEPCADPAKEIK